MSPRGSVTPVVASGTASVVKLLVASLAFAGAYVGVEASRTASVPARASVTAGTAAGGTPVETVVLSSKSMQDTTEQAPARGTILVSPVTGSRECDRPYRIQSVIDNPNPARTVSYGWRLQRWSEGSRTWRTYLSGNSGFTGRRQTVEWQPRVVDNPGWYRATLSVSDGTTLRSAKFRVNC
ncbi:hypothetical protein [Streptosporangium carneum]|uniref:Uncharacterized protein n=1 Tax=Streptosporangium carneum TaxID=47481 RepID=A0A9W6I7I3_9ACTN|nr:hypothetical protein [Streptosporangium carneum]GLK13547.1 hypothetical protein GCM10017600_69580 [Streptosporangium carneum]